MVAYTRHFPSCLQYQFKSRSVYVSLFREFSEYDSIASNQKHTGVGNAVRFVPGAIVFVQNPKCPDMFSIHILKYGEAEVELFVEFERICC